MQPSTDGERAESALTSYEPPAIEEREPLCGPLVGITATGAG